MTDQFDTPAAIDVVFQEALARHGVLDGELLHDEIADPHHPLHHRYEWDDSVAGRKFRVNQINSDIRRVQITFWTDDDPAPKKVRKYTPVKYTGDTERLRGYVETEKVLLNPLQQRFLLREMRRKMAELQARYGHMEEFAALLRSMVDGDDGNDGQAAAG
jgi:hypothetical protein